MMKKILLKTVILLGSLGLMINSLAAVKKAGSSIQFVNNSGVTLSFISEGNNQNLLPDMPLSLSTGSRAKVTVLYGSAPNAMAFVRGTPVLKTSSGAGSVFFGLAALPHGVQVSGFISEGIAYSWALKKLIFCTPQAYTQNGGRCPRI